MSTQKTQQNPRISSVNECYESTRSIIERTKSGLIGGSTRYANWLEQPTFAAVGRQVLSLVALHERRSVRISTSTASWCVMNKAVGEFVQTPQVSAPAADCHCDGLSIYYYGQELVPLGPAKHHGSHGRRAYN
eukprot:2356640-Amphidinium_carterae.1